MAPETNPQGELWQPGSAPSQSLEWATQAVAKAGTIGVIGVFPPQAMTFPIGAVQQRNLTIRGGNCNHRRYIPRLIGIVVAGTVDPTNFITDRGGANPRSLKRGRLRSAWRADPLSGSPAIYPRLESDIIFLWSNLGR